MTIDEAIEKQKQDNEYNKSIGCDVYYEEQITEWLEELKLLRENANAYSKEYIELNRKAMYNKAIDDFAEHIRAYYALKKEMGYVATTYDDLIKYIFELAQQLKEREK